MAVHRRAPWYPSSSPCACSSGVTLTAFFPVAFVQTLVKFCLVALIFVSLMSILSETVRFPNESLNQTLLLTVTVVEIIFTAVFTIEYIIR